MIKVGITGGIGSGKSTVSKVFELLGVPVFNADDTGRKLLLEDENIQDLIKDEFGAAVFNKDVIDRKALAEIVFKDANALERLNKIIHPKVKTLFEVWLIKHEDQPYTIKEAAILIESNSYRDLDVIITVSSPKELRLKRIVKRDNVSEEHVLARMNNQLSEEEKIKLSQYVIVNDEEKMVIPQVLETHKKLTA